MAEIDLADYVTGQDETHDDYLLWKCATCCGVRITADLGYVVDSLTFEYECPDCALDVYTRCGGTWTNVSSLTCDGSKHSFTVTNCDMFSLLSTIRADFKLYRIATVSPAPPTPTPTPTPTPVPQMDKETFLSKIKGKIDGDAIGRPPLGDEFKWWTYGGVVWFWGKTDWQFAVGIVFGGKYFGCDNPANPPTSAKCILFYDENDNPIETQDETICNAALAALPYLVPVTFVTKDEHGAELHGVKVYINENLKGET